MAESKMTNNQLAENVRMYASAPPALQKDSVQTAMVRHLIALCGSPADPKTT